MVFGRPVRRIGVIGAGVMGSAHARVIAQSGHAEVAFVVDPNRESGERVAERVGARYLPDLDGFAGCDAVIVAAPTECHTTWVHRALQADVPVLVEKPVSHDFDETRAIVLLAAQRGVPLMCSLPERFNAAFATAAEIVEAPLHLVAQRHSPYSNRIKTGVASDLMIHDLDLIVRLVGRPPESLQSHFAFWHPTSAADAEDCAQVVLGFGDGVVASVSASRLGQRKVRSLSITEFDRLIEVDLLRSDVTVYHHVGNEVIDDGPGYRQQTIIDIPYVHPLGEPLACQFERFVDLIEGRVDPRQELDTVLVPHELIARAQSAAVRTAAETAVSAVTAPAPSSFGRAPSPLQSVDLSASSG
jgi:predicted dehydrogenase